MKVQNITRITCEGCGAFRDLRDANAVPNTFPIHESLLDRSQALNEEGCLELRQKAEAEMERHAAHQEALTQRLADLCATDPEFRSLCSLYPEESGNGPNWSSFGSRMEMLADRAEPGISVGFLTGYSSSSHHALLGRCIAHTREVLDAET